MDMQALVDGMNAKFQRERAETQLTLGKLIAALEAMPNTVLVANLRGAHSYRGYYSDLAFERSDGTRPAPDLLHECRAAMGRVFEGYKGGDFIMGELTPLWIAEYGRTGDKLISVQSGGHIETRADD